MAACGRDSPPGTGGVPKAAGFVRAHGIRSGVSEDQGVIAAIGIGSNLGDRAGHVGYAVGRLGGLPGTRLVGVGPVIETEAVGRVGVDPGGAYLNSVAVLRTSVPARALLEMLHQIERERGRVRAGVPSWSARTLDLDLLVYGDAVIDEPGLVVPHPRMAERRFVLEPLAAVSPGLVVPGIGGGRTALELLTALAAKPGVQG